jgi:transcription antitermination factor NusG
MASEAVDDRKWYAVHTRARHEKQVAQRIAAQQLETYLPVHRGRHLWKNGVYADVEIPLFPCYLFAKASLHEQLLVLRVPGVLGLVASSSRPTAIREIEMQMLRIAIEQLQAEPHQYMNVGDVVRIISGPLAGLEGILTRRKNQYRVVLSVEAIVRSIVVEVSEHDIEPCKTRTACMEATRLGYGLPI